MGTGERQGELGDGSHTSGRETNVAFAYGSGFVKYCAR